jgi:hypothetical protein
VLQGDLEVPFPFSGSGRRSTDNYSVRINVSFLFLLLPSGGILNKRDSRLVSMGTSSKSTKIPTGN